MITLRTPEETLVVVPHIIGYMPSHGLVLCGLDQHGTDAAGQRACIGPIVTFDYGEGGLPDDRDRLMFDVVRRHRVTKAVIVLYCDDLDELDGDMRRRLAELHAAAARAMGPVGSGFLATFAADSTRFTRIDGDDGSIRSLRELEASEAAAHLVYEGSAPLPSRPAADVAPKPEALREQARLAARCIEDRALALEEELTLMDLLVAAWTGGIPAGQSGAAPLTRSRSDSRPKEAQARQAGGQGQLADAPVAQDPPDSVSAACAGAAAVDEAAACAGAAIEEKVAACAEASGASSASREDETTDLDPAGASADPPGPSTDPTGASQDPTGANPEAFGASGACGATASGPSGGLTGPSQNPTGAGQDPTGPSALPESVEASRESLGTAEDWARLCGTASRALTDTEVRDRVLLYGIDPGVRLPLLSLSQQDVADGLAAATQRTPDIDRLRSTCALLEEIASYRAPGEHAALAAAGYLHWWSCSNTMAAHRALAAVKLEPGYPLADLLLDVVNSGIMAPWYEGRGECDRREEEAESRPGRVA